MTSTPRLASRMSRRQYQTMDNSSGVGVLDKAAIVLGALEAGPATLAGLVQATGLARPTAHRLAVALEYHRLVARDLQGRFVLGPRLGELAAAAGRGPAAGSRRSGALRAARHDRRERPALPPPGRGADLRGRGRAALRAARHGARRLGAPDDGRLRGADPAGLGGARAHAPRPAARALHRDGPGRRTATRLGAERRRARGRRRLGVGAGARALRQGRRRGQRLRARSSGSPGPRAACTRPPSSAPRTPSPRPCAATPERVPRVSPRRVPV